jgi:hypothetical protein
MADANCVGERVAMIIAKLPPVEWPKPVVLPLTPLSSDDIAYEANRKRFRELLWQAQDDRCARCGERMGRGGCSLDHVQPLALGGRNWLGNLLLMHKPCNQKKANSPPSPALLRHLDRVNHWIFIREGVGVFLSRLPKGRVR